MYENDLSIDSDGLTG